MASGKWAWVKPCGCGQLYGHYSSSTLLIPLLYPPPSSPMWMLKATLWAWYK